MKRPVLKILGWCFLTIFLLLGIGGVLLFWSAQSLSRLDAKTVAKLKKPITPDEEKKLLELTTPLLGSPSKTSKPRVVILGMDGLDFQYLDPLIKEGKVPNFKKVMEEGAKGVLLSMVPPNSAGAWPALVTGCHPGKTNLLNFRTYDPVSRKIVLTDGRYLRKPALWDILGTYGKKSVAINEPMSYPPHQIEGVMVCGLITPEGKPFTYPVALSNVLDEIGYKREAVPKGEGFFAPQSTLLSDLLLTERKRLELAILLMKRTDWDLFFCMFSSTDRMMHYIGRFFKREDLDTNLIEMDRVLGTFLEHLPEETTLFVVSDHGFDLYSKQFSVPRWLVKEGYWVLPERKMPKQTSLFRAMRFLKGLQEKMPLPDIPVIRWPQSLQIDHLRLPVDWEKSTAIAVETGGNWGSIRILKRQDKGKLEKEIASKLLLLTDPVTGERFVKQILSGDELYAGSYREAMPDLVFELSKLQADFALHPELFWNTPTYHHRREGVFLAWGRGIRNETLSSPAHPVDIAPTTLYLLDLPIGEGLDGEILEPLLIADLLSSQTPKRVPEFPPIEIKWVGLPEESSTPAKDVQETLRSLGYLQ